MVLGDGCAPGVYGVVRCGFDGWMMGGGAGDSRGAKMDVWVRADWGVEGRDLGLRSLGRESSV